MSNASTAQLLASLPELQDFSHNFETFAESGMRKVNAFVNICNVIKLFANITKVDAML